MRGIPADWLQQRMGGMRLGEILLDHAVLNSAQLTCALAIAKERGRRLGEVLIDLELATTGEISTALDEQRRMEVT